MPVELSCLVENRLIYQHAYGELCHDDFTDTSRQVHRLLASCPDRNSMTIVINMSAVKSFPHRTNLAQSLAYLNHPSCQSALVICPNKLLFHAFRMTAQVCNMKITSVSTFEEAIQHLAQENAELAAQLANFSAAQT